MTDRIACVFGGTGFLGRRIVLGLHAAGWSVRVAARRPSPPEGIDADRIELQRADIRDERAVARAMQDAHAVVNAVSLYVETPATSFHAIHAAGAERLARVARERGVARVVHVSGIGADSSSASRYVAARGHGERLVRERFPGVTIMRPSAIFGADDAFLGALDRITRLPIVPLFGSGATRLQPVHVDDVAAAIARALQRPDTAGRIYELGGPRVYTYREIIERVLAGRGRRRLLVPVPWPVWKGLAAAVSLLPNPPLTRDQVALMARDNIAGSAAATFEDLDLEPAVLDEALTSCLPSE